MPYIIGRANVWIGKFGDAPGSLGATITQVPGAHGISIQGLSVVGIGRTALFDVALARPDVTKASRVLKRTL